MSAPVPPPPPMPPFTNGGLYLEGDPRTTEPTGSHRCNLPAEWPIGALWQCTELHLWQCVKAGGEGRGIYTVPHRVWAPAGWRLRRRHGGHKATAEMANENRSSIGPKPRPPSGPSGISPSRRGR